MIWGGDVILLDLGLLPHLEQYQLISQQIQSRGRWELSKKHVSWYCRYYHRLRVSLQPLWPISIFSFIGNKAVLSSSVGKSPSRICKWSSPLKTRTPVFSAVHPRSSPCLKLLNPVSKCTVGRARGEPLPPRKKPDLKNSRGDN